MSSCIDEIRRRIEEGLHPQLCELVDESSAHVGHAGQKSGAGHFRLKIVADCFLGVTRITRHRMVYDCVLSMMHREVHALAIIALTPQEYENFL